jgi:hypothetical protein
VEQGEIDLRAGMSAMACWAAMKSARPWRRSGAGGGEPVVREVGEAAGGADAHRAQGVVEQRGEAGEALWCGAAARLMAAARHHRVGVGKAWRGRRPGRPGLRWHWRGRWPAGPVGDQRRQRTG